MVDFAKVSGDYADNTPERMVVWQELLKVNAGLLKCL